MIVEKIGYFQRTDLADFENRTEWSFADFGKAPPLHFGARDAVEADDTAVQPVPVLVITNKERNSVLVVKKRAKSMHADSPEKDKTLVYMGGHIREEDRLHGLKEELLSIAATTLSREIQEELSLSLEILDEEPLCVWLKMPPRSAKHMAMAYLYQADFEHLAYSLDEFEFVQKTGRSKSGRVIRVADLKSSEMEEWSRIILKSKVGVDVGGPFLFER